MHWLTFIYFYRLDLTTPPLFFSPKMKFPFLLVLLASFISRHIGMVSSSQCHFPAIFNLGDSNSDTGGLTSAFSGLNPPYGETFFRMPAGRYSDGRLIIDFIAEQFGFSYLSAYLDSVGANFSIGANFATGGSTILPQNSNLGYSPFSLDVQIKQFLLFRSRSRVVAKRGGVFKHLLPKEDYYSRALYTFDIGQNDITASYDNNQTADEFIPNAMNQFSNAVKTIYQNGGRFFWIHNTGPIGCLAYVLLRVPLQKSQYDSTGCGIPHNELAQKFNRKLYETVVRLRKELPLAALTYVDIYSVKYSLFAETNKHGFEQPLKVCCGYGGGDYNFDYNVRCGATSMKNGTKVLLGRSCKDPSRRINWDGVHYTEAANKWVFDQISGGEFSDPPIPVSMACSKSGP